MMENVKKRSLEGISACFVIVLLSCHVGLLFIVRHGENHPVSLEITNCKASCN